MINLKSRSEVSDEFEDVLISFVDHHDNMDKYKTYYDSSAVYESKAGGQRQNSDLVANLLKTFADKNTFYTSQLPSFKVAPEAADLIARESADIREKTLYATHRENNTGLKQKDWAFDGTIRSQAVEETYYDFDTRSVKINRYDPRYVYFQYADDNSNKMLAAWVAFPVTKSFIKRRYGKDVKDGTVDPNQISNSMTRLDNQEYVLMIKRWDDKTKTVLAGDTFIEEAHPHGLDVNPLGICFPFTNGSDKRLGDFYLRQLVPLQAEFNETLRRRANIVRKLGNPLVWSRGMVSRQFEEVKKALRGDGGFVGLKGQGELGLLQIPETQMIDNHLAELFQRMKDLGGFPTATFGEVVGSNTSGDALGMYFTPTIRAIEDQQIAWRSFYEVMNWKILALYDRFLMIDERKQLTGYTPTGGQNQGGFNTTLTREHINGNYNSEVIFKSSAPKDEIAYKRLLMEMVNSGVISRTTAYEEMGLLSPQDELDLLEKEQSNPALNPEGMAQLMSASNQGVQDGPFGKPTQPAN